jgi:hypothetical protein
LTKESTVDLNVNALMLGARGFGKTCYVASMYNAMSFGLDGFLLTATDFAQRIEIDSIWTALAEGKPLGGTLEGTDFLFSCAYAFEPIMTVSWYDYPGNWLMPEKENDRTDFDKLLDRLTRADFVMCCVPVDELVEGHRLKRPLSCFHKYNDLFMEFGRRQSPPYPHVMYVITKADLCKDPDLVSRAIDFYISKAPFRGKNWPEISVVPVSLGMGITIDAEEAKILTVDRLDPANVHIPILYAISKKLDVCVKEALNQLEGQERSLQQTRRTVTDLSSGLLQRWWNSGEIARSEGQGRQSEQKIKDVTKRCEELNSQLELISEELAKSMPLVYRDGVRLK